MTTVKSPIYLLVSCFSSSLLTRLLLSLSVCISSAFKCVYVCIIGIRYCLYDNIFDVDLAPASEMLELLNRDQTRRKKVAAFAPPITVTPPQHCSSATRNSLSCIMSDIAVLNFRHLSPYSTLAATVTNMLVIRSPQKLLRKAQRKSRIQAVF